MAEASKETKRNSQIEVVPITQEMQKAYLDYAMSVIVSRALPDVRDGLKPVQRRIIYAMHDQGMTPGSRYQKCAAVVGEVLKKYHPHGDLSVYDALVRMAQDFSLRYPLVDGQGNFGSVDGDNPAAMRYTECRLDPISAELLLDIEKNTVDFAPNYSGEIREPQVLPALLPNLLLNGATGIAVGMATNIPPHNLQELVEALIFLIDKGAAIEPRLESEKFREERTEITPKTSFESEAIVEDILNYVTGPDFPTGGEIYDKNEILQAYTTGRGKIVMRGVVEIEETQGDKMRIIATELPFQVNKSQLISRIADLVRKDKIRGISDLRDESDREGLRVVIELKKDVRPQRVLNQLYQHTDLQKAFNVNTVALVNGEPKVLTLKQLLTEFVRHRQTVVIRRTIFILKKAREREHILEGLIVALRYLDEVIETIKKSPDAEAAKVNLIKRFKLSEIQAQAILEMQLRRLAALERKKIKDELEEIKKKISDYEAFLVSPAKILNQIKKEFAGLKEKYGDERRTKVFKRGLKEFQEEDLIAAEEVIVTLTESGYIKRLTVDTYRRQSRGGKGVLGMRTKEEDVVSHVISANTHDRLLLFSNSGKVHSIKVHEIPEASRTAKGTALVNIIDIEQKEIPQSLVVLKQTSQPKYLFFTTKNGTVKRTALTEFENIRRTGIIAIKLDRDDELCWVKPTFGKDEIILVTAQGQSIRFRETDVRPMGRGAGGVRGIRLKKKGDLVVGMDLVDKKADLLVVTKKGLGKRSRLERYTLQKRGGSGTRTAKITAKTGPLVASKVIHHHQEKADILLTSEAGQVIRLPVKEVPRHGRATQGVRVIRLNEGDTLAALTVLEEKPT